MLFRRQWQVAVLRAAPLPSRGLGRIPEVRRSAGTQELLATTLKDLFG
jgi:hypothetical protein